MNKEKQLEHHFIKEEALKYGVEKAILLYNIRFCLNLNKANKRNIRKHTDGNNYFWTYNSGKAFEELFPYMKRKSILKWLTELETKHGILASGNFNKRKYDKTKWYTILSEFSTTISCPQEGLSMSTTATSMSTTATEPMSVSATGLSTTATPIPDNKLTDNKQRGAKAPALECAGRAGDGLDFEKPITKKDSRNNTGKTPEEVEENKYIRSMIGVFAEINEFIKDESRGFYGRKCQRDACRYIFKEFGYEGGLNLVRMVVDRRNEKGMPVITTPLSMKEKLADLKIYLSRQETLKKNHSMAVGTDFSKEE